jgi:threonine/homoserine/homoserine lactone efflux protein
VHDPQANVVSAHATAGLFRGIGLWSASDEGKTGQEPRRPPRGAWGKGLDLTLVLTGMGVGFAFSAPVGPVNLLCVRKCIASGFRAGLFTGLGAAIADALYAAVGAFGVTTVLTFVEDHARIVQAAGGALVLGFGLATLHRMSQAALMREKAMERYQGLFAGFALTLANPGVLFGFIAVFGGFGEALIEAGDYEDAAVLVLGILIGAMLWWSSLAFLVSRLRTRLDGRWFRAVNGAAGIVLIAIGAVLIGRAALGMA